MASTYSDFGKRMSEEEIFVPRKRFKISELPLNSAQRLTIDGLLHTIKKKGEYDALRKKVWSQFAESDANKAFNSTLNDLAEAEIDRDPSLLSRDRGKAATLMQGAVDRSDIYKSVEAALDALIQKNISQVYEAGRDIRRAEVGEDLTAEEEKRGSKTDEEYAQQSAARREAREREKERAEEESRERAREQAREQARQEAMQRLRQQEEESKRREAEMDKLKAEELSKRLELEKLDAEKNKREEEAMERRRAIDREAHEREAQHYRLKKENERRELHERREREMEVRERDRHRKQESVRSRHEETGSVRPSDTTCRLQPSEFIKEPLNPPPPAPVDENALEEAALQLLLREGREMAAKSASKPDLERSESLDPLHRKSSLFPKAKFSESPPVKVASPLRSPLKKPDHQPVPKLRYGATAIQEPPDAAYQSHDHTGSHSSQPRHSRNHSRSQSHSKTRRLSRRTEEPRDFEHEAVTYWKTKAYAQRESDAEAWKRGEVRRRSDNQEHDLQQDRYHQDHHHHRHHRHSERPNRERGPRSRERRHERSRSPDMKSSRVAEHVAGRAERLQRFSVKSVVESVDDYVPVEGEGIEREKNDGERDRRERGREEISRRERRREERERREAVREERDRSDGPREEKYREGGREERYREGGREERYRREGAREDNYRRDREGWRDGKPRVVHVAPIDRYVPGGGELKRRGREGENGDRYIR